MDNKEIPSGRIRLYHFPGTRALRARWMLEELALPYSLEHVNLRQGAHKRKKNLAIHPLGKVPAMEIDGTVIFESLAICLCLADRYWEAGLAPVPEEAVRRTEYYKWMAFSTGTLEPAIIEQLRLLKAKKRHLDPIDMGPTLTPLQNAAAYVEHTTANRPFLLGKDFSAADIMNGSLMMWADSSGCLDGFEQTKDWTERLKARPAYLRAIEKINVTSDKGAKAINAAL